MNTMAKLAVVLVATTMAGFSTAHAEDGMAYGRSQAPAPLEGTWLVSIKPYSCATGIDVPNVPPVISYLTFGAGGTYLEATSNPAFDRGQRGPGHGFWERTGRSTYRAVHQAFILFDSASVNGQPPRYVRGHQRIDQGIEMQDNDSWTSTASVQFFAVGSSSPIPPSGCARATATRMN
jgi:hypothetical protein